MSALLHHPFGNTLVPAQSSILARRLLNAQELIVFCQTIRAAQRTGLDLAAVCSRRMFDESCVLGFARAMREDGDMHNVDIIPHPDNIDCMNKPNHPFLSPWFCCWLVVAIAFNPSVRGTEQKPGAFPLYRMNQLDDAKKRAEAEGKPIAWIASTPQYLSPYNKSLLGKGSHAATAYAIRALQNDAVLVFSDSFTENHQEPRIIDEALHSPKSHYDVPGVIILTPALDKVITKAFYLADSQERIKAFTEILKQIRDKDSWREKTPSK